VTKRILIIAGPNGAGKTTMAWTLIQNSQTVYEFINADEIARGLAPIHPESVALAASKLMILRLRELLASNKNFAFETTASGINYLKHLKEAQSKGYEVNLIFLWLPHPDQAVERVAERVKQGGHDIPEESIRRRYGTGLKNLLKHYLPLVNSALILNNSTNQSGRVIAKKDARGHLEVKDMKSWKKIERSAHDKT
jgi:predicted ABC-type ATPase